MDGPTKQVHGGSPNHESSSTDETPVDNPNPWWRKHPVIAVAVVVGALALAVGLVALALLIALWIWIVASGGLFPNK